MRFCCNYYFLLSIFSILNFFSVRKSGFHNKSIKTIFILKNREKNKPPDAKPTTSVKNSTEMNP